MVLLLRHVEPECKHDAPQQVSTEAAFNGKIFRSCCRRLAEGVAAVSLTLALTDSDESTCDFPNRESPVFFYALMLKSSPLPRSHVPEHPGC